MTIRLISQDAKCETIFREKNRGHFMLRYHQIVTYFAIHDRKERSGTSDRGIMCAVKSVRYRA